MFNILNKLKHLIKNYYSSLNDSYLDNNKSPQSKYQQFVQFFNQYVDTNNPILINGIAVDGVYHVYNNMRTSIMANNDWVWSIWVMSKGGQSTRLLLHGKGPELIATNIDYIDVYTTSDEVLRELVRIFEMTD